MEVPYPSKVNLPARRPAVIRRQRLIELLAEGLQRRLTLVSAAAGYGKTTLLLDFAQSWNAPVCWYSLDERDRDLQTFLRYLLASGQRRFPGFGMELARELQQARPLAPEAVVDLLVMAVQSLGQPFVLVLDDFHYLDEAPDDLRQVLDGWLYRLPDNCHLILSGRTWPQLAVLPLMSARQEVATIAGPEFAFACEEVVQLFRDVLGKEISLDDAQHLADLTEGWAAALILMADKVQAARTSISLEQLRGSDTLFQYIKLEQFDPLPADVKEFLVGAAVPRAIQLEFLNQLLGTADAEERLNFLERRNLFVLREKADQGSYRCHRLFRAFLISHLRSQDPARFHELNLTAAALREQARDWQEAVYHYLQASAWESIVQVTERVGWQLFEEGKWDTLAEWLEAIPPEELAVQPKLVLWKARILHYLNQVDRALALLAQAIVSFEATSDWVAQGQALITKGMCLRVKGDYRDAKEALSKARTLLLKHDGPTSVLTEARKELGTTLGMSGEFGKALEELKGVLMVYEAQGDAYNIAHVHNEIGNALMALGQLSEAAVHLEKARQRWLRLGNGPRLLQTLNNLAFTYYLGGDYDRADQVWREALQKTYLEASRKHEAYVLLGLGDVRRDKGQYTEALEFYQPGLEVASRLDESYVRIYIMDGIANTYRLMGDIANGESWASQAMAEAEEGGGTFETGFCTLTRGLLQRDHGQLKEAAASIEKAAGLLKGGDAKRELATAYFHLAGVYFSLKRKRLALECLDMVARLVQELGYDHFLVVEARRAPLLVQYASANKLADGYFGRLLKVIKATPAVEPEISPQAPQSEEAGVTTVYAYGFGNLRVEIAGREITDLEWRSEKSKEMFFFFLGNRRPLRKEEIVAALWPDLAEDKTGSAFHSTLYRLRQALYPECIAKDSGRYILDPRGRFVFDVEEFQRAARQADALAKGAPDALALMEQALALYQGSFAQDFYSEWAETLRWQMEEQYMRLLTTLAAARSQSGDFKSSAELTQRILDVDEYNEAAWYRLMSSYIQSGHLEAAKYCYNRYVQILSESLDGERPPDFEEVQRQIIKGGAPA
ncbi:MAG: tetratricopeptide repeat protein [Chloroflexi bacterium]|nr:tetratricopeptide repeat protein [Chloroflexota bacterium]